jgi:hypothetical protein
LIGNRIDASTDMISTPPTTDNERGEEMWKNGAIIILNPIKARMMARPNFNLSKPSEKAKFTFFHRVHPSLTRQFVIMP